MYCKWCGMDSETETKCSWCGKPLEPPSPQEDLGDLEETIARPHTAEKPVPEPAPGQSDEAKDQAPAPDAIEIGEGVGFESDRPPEPPKQKRKLESFDLRLRKYLSIMLILQAGAMVIVHFYPDSWLGQFLPLLFIAGLLMGILKIVPDFEESMLPDIYTITAVTVLLGPFYAMVIYWFLASTRRSVNPSVIWLMVAYLVLRVMVGVAAHGPLDTTLYVFVPNLSLSPMSHAAELVPLLVIGAGWALSRFARDFIDELSWE